MAFDVPLIVATEEVFPMADAAPNYEERQEFWKPAGFPRAESEPVEAGEHICRQCGGDLIVESQYCHICGANRGPVLGKSAWRRFPSLQDIAAIRDALGQTAASLVALVLGFTCLVATLVTGILFSAATLVDWQAVQLWRIQWLLASIAFFVAGVLLKKARN